MARELKATRYLRAGNEELARFISTELHYLDFYQTMAFYDWFVAQDLPRTDWALLGANDRYFLLTAILKRKDAIHPWLFERAREVEEEPDECLDLWSREHYKSTIITFAGSIQEVIVDPEITIGIFSFTKDVAAKFVGQIQQELENNEDLQLIYPDVFWEKPKSDAPLWSTMKGLTVKRRSNPKEATWEPHGLTRGQPTSRHFKLRIYDDIITLEFVSNPEMVNKATVGWEMSDNLGSNQPGKPARRWHVGTRYSFSDTYGIILERNLLKPRLYPATDNGREDGTPVYWSQEIWEAKKKSQVSTFAAQLLQNPAAGNEATFRMEWLKPWFIRPTILNIYIMGDPSLGARRKNTDRTAIPVIGVDANLNKYLLDGYCHRMKPSERWSSLKRLRRKWLGMPGVQRVDVGWERYSMQSDLQYFEEKMREEGISFDIAELSWTREGNQSKKDRVERLQPDFNSGNFFVPGVVRHEVLEDAFWAINLDKNQIDYRRMEGPTRAMKAAVATHQEHRVCKPIRRQDEEGNVYDLTRMFFEEFRFFPFSSHDDLIDAMSRIYDMEPVAPVVFEQSFESLIPDYPDA